MTNRVVANPGATKRMRLAPHDARVFEQRLPAKGHRALAANPKRDTAVGHRGPHHLCSNASMNRTVATIGATVRTVFHIVQSRR
jgi:hypothetical protein